MQIPLIGNTITEKKGLGIALFRPSCKGLKLTWAFSVFNIQMNDQNRFWKKWKEGRIFLLLVLETNLEKSSKEKRKDLYIM